MMSLKRLNIMNLLEKLIILILLILVVYLKSDCNAKINKIEQKISDHDHAKNINARKFFCEISARKFSKQKWFC